MAAAGGPCVALTLVPRNSYIHGHMCGKVVGRGLVCEGLCELVHPGSSQPLRKPSKPAAAVVVLNGVVAAQGFEEDKELCVCC